MPSYRVISIGALSRNELWSKQVQENAAHATTTLIESGDKRILVDPALPPQILLARLAERTGLGADDITDVFLTTFRPAHRMGLEAFPKANWWVSKMERETAGAMLVERFQMEEGDEDLQEHLRKDIALLQKCQAAPDKLAPNVDLFPLYGFSAGTCGLLISMPKETVMIAGDAIASAEHLIAGRVLRGAVQLEQAQDAITEIIEIADTIVPGHDNVVRNPMRRAPMNPFE